ncbi:MAG: histidinol-phosphate transaminase [Rhodocyclaceae bacterium]|nr:histidinol-phosphate transaminase [Rhodocyclaceae bacterium]
MSRFWSKVARDLTPYVPGEQPKLPNLVKLNTNENPYGPSPRALSAIREATGDALRLYPDPNGDALKAAVAHHFRDYGIESKQVFVGNGSDEVLAHAFLGLLKHDAPILFPDITYSFYPVYCGLYGVEFRTLPLDEDFQMRVEDYLTPTPSPASGRGERSAATPENRLGGIIFPNPNAPTGRLLPLDQVERLVAGNPDSVVVVDEAYVDFAGEVIPTAIALVNRYPNLLVVQTLSKSRSLAGLRAGFAVGDAALIEALERVKNSFNSYPLDRLALVGATAAVADEDWFHETRGKVMASRERLTARLESLGFQVLPSSANFIFARHAEHDGGELAAALRARGIIVRHFRQARIEQFLRITIGTEEQCQALVAALADILGRGQVQ